MDQDQQTSLSALDATFLELEEADESAHMHIGGVMILEERANDSGGAPPIARLREEIEARLPRLPRYTQRLSEPRTGGLRWPRWLEDGSFRIENHVFVAALPDPAGIEELRRWAGEYFSIRLDRRRPLWELAVLELGDSRWALVSKTHHCLVDGVGSVDAAKMLLDLQPDAATPNLGDDDAPPPEDDGGDGDGGLLDARRLAGRGLRLAGTALRRTGSAVLSTANTLERARHPEQIAAALRQAQAVVEIVVRDEIHAAPKSSINGPIGGHRRLAILVVPLRELKEIRAGLGGTVNDVVLAAAAGGLRRLLLERGEELPEQGLRAMVPVNIRPAAERLALGNRITSLFVHLPVGEAQPLARYRRQLEEAEGLKSGNQAIGSRGMIDLTALAPPAMHSFIARSLFATRLFNLTITNVPGPQQPLYALGARVEEIWPIVPLAAEHALGLAVLSYDGSISFCVNADHDSCADLEVLREGIEAELELLGRIAAAGVDEAPAPLKSASG